MAIKNHRFTSLPIEVEFDIKIANPKIPLKTRYLRYPKERHGKATQVGFFDKDDTLIATGFAQWVKQEIQLTNLVTNLVTN